MKVLQDSLFAM